MSIEEPRPMREVHEWRRKLQQQMATMSGEERLAYIRNRANRLLRRTADRRAKVEAETT